MRRSIRTSYTHTILASYLGYITQAVVNNFAPLLFLTFRSQMGLTLEQITLLTTLNFSIQLLVDFLSVKVVDRIGYRPCVVAAHLFSAAGLASLAVLPQLLGNAYAGLMLAVTLYAMGGGLIEVLVSPIVEACPTEKKEVCSTRSIAGAMWRSCCCPPCFFSWPASNAGGPWPACGRLCRWSMRSIFPGSPSAAWWTPSVSSPSAVCLGKSCSGCFC